jgi:uncharacterized membrane protein
MNETAEVDAGPARTEFSPSELGAIAHLYRGEVYRSTVWRSRLDHTTNWAVVTTGLALSLSYADSNASALPLVLVGLLVAVFLVLEARRYRYFNVWRARCRLMETDFYAPILRGEGAAMDGKWNTLLAHDYHHPGFHVSMLVALGRRLRKNYLYILAVQVIAYLGKIFIHPVPLDAFGHVFERAAIGPVPGAVVLIAGALFHSTWFAIAIWTLLGEREARRRGRLVAIG